MAKINEMEMKGGAYDKIIPTFYRDINPDDKEEFSQKITGYLCVYAPYYIHFMETDDEEYLNEVLHRINNEI